MDDEIGDTSVKQETMSVAAHFRFIDPLETISPCCSSF
jgi:hypothetical protein